MDVLIALVIGLVAGLHTSTWGMYKDAPYEGFAWPKYFRSTIIGGIVGVAVYWIVGLDVRSASGMVVLFGFTYVIERALLEFYKTFLRVEDQSKYFIPMQFSVKGEVVENRAIQLSVGFFWMGVVLSGVYGIYWLQKSAALPSALYVLLLVGSFGGWISAIGGAWKDAPKEGFETLKFFRSPVIALIYAFVLAHFTDNYILISLGALGYTVATIETYKTFFFPNKPRGKFAGKEIRYPEMLERRKYFVPIYVAIWAAIIVTMVVAFVQPHTGLLHA